VDHAESTQMRALAHLTRHDDAVSPEQFVAALKVAVFDSAIADVSLSLRSRPPGQSPRARATALHEWFVGLSSHDQEMVLEVARDAAHASLFGVLCVLDGARAIDDPPHDQIILTMVSEDRSTVHLNAEGADLHDELDALVHLPSEPSPGH
jgi:hypothetical protein